MLSAPVQLSIFSTDYRHEDVSYDELLDLDMPGIMLRPPNGAYFNVENGLFFPARQTFELYDDGRFKLLRDELGGNQKLNRVIHVGAEFGFLAPAFRGYCEQLILFEADRICSKYLTASMSRFEYCNWVLAIASNLGKKAIRSTDVIGLDSYHYDTCDLLIISLTSQEEILRLLQGAKRLLCNTKTVVFDWLPLGASDLAQIKRSFLNVGYTMSKVHFEQRQFLIFKALEANYD